MSTLSDSRSIMSPTLQDTTTVTAPGSSGMVEFTSIPAWNNADRPKKPAAMNEILSSRRYSRVPLRQHVPAVKIDKNESVPTFAKLMFLSGTQNNVTLE